MVKAMITDSGGQGLTINVDPGEMATICKYLDAIFVELETRAVPNLEKLNQIHYYTAGKAKKAVKIDAKANRKVMDLYDHYNRASALVMDILGTMMETDQAMAEQIREKMGD
ncbi:hypothetical protein ACFO4N_16660 [Camelliibacillus cellulosilyticus]|uniref:Uncharacterized protein n=1 Tax=Camelliibacillus cellulosilyticus TaxID=2174486 RepID=A0ABV9GQ78_9BACL